MIKTPGKSLKWHCRRGLNVIWESLSSFIAGEAQLRAASLTYFTLFAIVPVFALLFGVAKGFELDIWLKRELTERMSEHNEILKWICNFADTTLQETRGGVVAGIGALILCWSVVKMIGNIEGAVNRVWHVQKNRTIFRKFTDYLSFLVIVPVLLLAASSATVFVSGYLRNLSETNTLISWSRPIIEFGLLCVPYLIVWMLFTFIYIFLPNTRVRFDAALFGGVIAGTICQLLQGGYIFVQIALSRYNVIYGSFSALPLFLIWIYLNWLILLFGVSLSFFYQTFDFESKQARDCERTKSDKRLLALLISAVICRNFAGHKEPPSISDLAGELNLSHTMTGELTGKLLHCGVIVSVAGGEYDQARYLPALPLAEMTVVNVLLHYDELRLAEESAVTSAKVSKVTGVMEDLCKAFTTTQADIPVQKLLD